MGNPVNQETSAIEAELVAERIAEAVGKLLRRFHAELSDPGFLRSVASRSLGIVATVDEADCAYVLCRVPSIARKVLSPRETEVALLVREGLSNQGIAFQLGLSRHSVAAHLRNIYSKLSIDSRFELAVLALDLGTDDHRSAPQLPGVGGPD